MQNENKRVPTRWRAGGIHLALSALVAVTVVAAVFVLWYPGLLFSVAGGRQIFTILVGVDVAIGPLLTLIVYRHGKKGLALDLAVIAMLQLAALMYGVWVLFEARPVYVVFAKDRFELVHANQIPVGESAKARDARYREPPVSGGPAYVGVRLPQDPDEQFRLMMSGLGGVDIQQFPRYYRPYEDVRSDAAHHAKPIAELRRLNPQSAAAIDTLVARSGHKETDLGFLPMRSGTGKDVAVIVDAHSGDVVDMADLRPWEF